jgi:hypothetical protein
METSKARLGITRYAVAQTSLEHVIDIITRETGPDGAVGSSMFASLFGKFTSTFIPPNWAPQVCALDHPFACRRLLTDVLSVTRLRTARLLTSLSTLMSGRWSQTSSTTLALGSISM